MPRLANFLLVLGCITVASCTVYDRFCVRNIGCETDFQDMALGVVKQSLFEKLFFFNSNFLGQNGRSMSKIVRFEPRMPVLYLVVRRHVQGNLHASSSMHPLGLQMRPLPRRTAKLRMSLAPPIAKTKPTATEKVQIQEKQQLRRLRTTPKTEPKMTKDLSSLISCWHNLSNSN